MGVSPSKEELVYQQVGYGNVEGIRALRSQGAGLEWIDKEGKTPLIVACLRHDLLPVAEALIDLGANVNAYRPGSYAGTPLHHAAKKGCEQMVHLLLSHGANPCVLNDDCHTALDLAREKGHLRVVRAIESRISLFSGWLREAFGPGFLETFAPQLLIRKIWAVVLPCDPRNPKNPSKFELVIYPDLQTARPRSVVSLWKAHIEEPKFNQVDPAIVIVEKATRTRYKLFAANEGDKQQLQWFLSACRGIPQVTSTLPEMQIGVSIPNPPQTVSNVSTQTAAATKRTKEDIEMEMAINASIQTAMAEGMAPVQSNPQTSETNGWGWGTISENTAYNGLGWGTISENTAYNGLGWGTISENTAYNGWGTSGTSNVNTTSKMNSRVPVNQPNSTNGWAVPVVQSDALPPPVQNLEPPVIQPSHEAPSAPPISEDTLFDSPIHYPSIDSSPINMSMTTMETVPGIPETKVAGAPSKTESSGEKPGSSGTSGCCVICLDAPVEGACIPCGHMAGCMSCLREIESKQWGCPVCRAQIDQVVRLYAV
ncbi:probable E3 ubiquitin-protein ligase XBOS34 isoform X2 [Zingiber officinale]|uniref:probable E3 ubiquitin-protein ligase XBOS34 isoform X2 n=1 Tax=Zingiber officinale TaxID=94328 RepID=UPI001C4C4904|nr:probable E3 ubiquitin-protein ligase XBOS34 isoform X2 [Zingiber officinale]